MKSLKKQKYNNIEAMRFLMCVIIVLFHILHSNIMNYTGGSAFYEALAEDTGFASAAVACFFILSGYFLYFSYYNHQDLSVGEFVYKKVARLWPVLFIVVLVTLIFFGGKISSSIFNVLFLQCVGISSEYTGITWYVSPMFWVLIFYFVLLKYVKNKSHLNIAVCVITFLAYAMLLNATDGYFTRGAVYGFISGGLLQALGGIGMGYLVAAFTESVKKMPSYTTFLSEKGGRVWATVLASIGEIGCTVLLLIHFLYKPLAITNQFIVVIWFTGLLISMVAQRGIMSRVLNNRFFGFFGKYTYSIYMVQQIAFYILQRTLWQNSAFVQNHALWCIAVSVLLTALLGVITYYVIEKPAAKLLGRLEKKIFIKAGENERAEETDKAEEKIENN